MSMFVVLFLISLCSSILGTIAGGSGLISLPAMMVFGIPIQVGIATNKFASGFGAFSSVIDLLKNGDLHWRGISKLFIWALLGGITGAIITTSLSESIMQWIAMGLLVLSLIISLNNKSWMQRVQADKREIITNKKSWVPYFIAAYDGGFGPGASTFGIIHFLHRNLSYIQSVQFTRVIIFGSCLGSFIIFYLTGFVRWEIAIPMACGAILGSFIGLRLVHKIPLQVARWLLLVVLLLLIGQVGWEMYRN